MASLIPALSEKARIEIRNKVYKDDDDIQFELSTLDCERAFQDLFDLEKYPITWEQLCEYLVKCPYYERVEAGSNIFFRCLVGKHKSITRTTDMTWVLKQLTSLTSKRDIDIIGDIHGWWEKPQTY